MNGSIHLIDDVKLQFHIINVKKHTFQRIAPQLDSGQKSFSVGRRGVLRAQKRRWREGPSRAGTCECTGRDGLIKGALPEEMYNRGVDGGLTPPEPGRSEGIGDGSKHQGR